MQQYNLIVGFFDGSGTSTMSGGRFYFPQKSQELSEYQGQTPANGALKSLCMDIPTIFTGEILYNRVPMARIGWITSITQSGRDFRLTYNLPSGIAAIPADRMANALGLDSFPSRGIGTMQHSHWTIKDGDVFKALLQAGALEDTLPSVFPKIYDFIQPNLVSIMMPFNQEFSSVYESIKTACENLGFEIKRADDIWEYSTVIQDIYSLIYRSKLVICDFSGKNPNVFYEAGIAHTLGRAVIPIVQNIGDIPFDLQQHRCLQYLNNSEGLHKLIAGISPRIKTLMELP